MFENISVEASAEKEAWQQVEGYPPADVDIDTTDGHVYRGCERHVPGHPQNPMRFEAVVEKFWQCVDLSIKPMSQKKLDQFLESVHTLERVTDTRQLVPLLSG